MSNTLLAAKRSIERLLPAAALGGLIAVAFFVLL